MHSVKSCSIKYLNLKETELRPGLPGSESPERKAGLGIRIDGSALSGKIPDLIGNLTRIDRLRISDLNGAPTGFPDLQNLTNMNTLILRNCLITGQIPAYLGELTAVKTL
ncbi:hypothetical protein F0562_029510 [Nyssa sinensis]|uniref:Leucine-rich repeat-containing N-terminal plant-type domain-containing protein n=1 Tax=Nyssa sinensis TaxID=561372 RepID=A0A5J5B591_9ASTE|nr:hypothetical protein F0562_029510 [Nyssa sinensis]